MLCRSQRHWDRGRLRGLRRQHGHRARAADRHGSHNRQVAQVRRDGGKRLRERRELRLALEHVLVLD
eukprot:7383852-Prymnesium_polylepis.3